MNTELISKFFAIIRELQSALIRNGLEVPPEVMQMIKEL